MTSAINSANPVTGSPTTSSVRANFAAAETEINELQRMAEDFVTAAGTDTYTANFTNDVTLADGVRVLCDFTNANTVAGASVTLNVDGTGAVQIVDRNLANLAIGDIVAGAYYDLVYDGTATKWVALNLNSSAVASGLMQIVYPVGSIYFNASDSTNPDTLLFGGNSDTTWALFGKGSVLVGLDDKANGGVAITAAEIVSNELILTFSSHNFSVGQKLTVEDLTFATTDPNSVDASGNPSTPYTITAITSTTATMALTGGDETFGVGSSPKATLFGFIGETGGEASHQLTEAELAAHTHDILSNATANGGSDNRMDDVHDDGDGTNTTAIQSAGGDEQHNNVQPYITVYMWQRTA